MYSIDITSVSDENLSKLENNEGIVLRLMHHDDEECYIDYLEDLGVKCEQAPILEFRTGERKKFFFKTNWFLFFYIIEEKLATKNLKTINQWGSPLIVKNEHPFLEDICLCTKNDIFEIESIITSIDSKKIKDVLDYNQLVIDKFISSDYSEEDVVADLEYDLIELKKYLNDCKSNNCGLVISYEW